MKKTLSIAIAAAVFAFGIAAGTGLAFAASPNNSDIPEKNGVYDVPGHPNLKVRVFVHYPKKSTAMIPQMCGADPRSDSVVHPAGWYLPGGAWKYVINSASVPASVGGKNFPGIVSSSFEQWAGTQSKVTFGSSGETKISAKKLDGKNVVTFGRASGSALAITYTWYYPSTGQVAETDTIMNLKFPWFWSGNACSSTAYDAQGILTHELGHWMGLNDEYDAELYAPNTMYGYGYKGETKDMTLTNGDVLGSQAIYK